MPASKEYWEQNPGVHCLLHFLAAAFCLSGDVAIVLNGGFGKKWGSPTETPANSPFLYWFGVVVIAVAGFIVLGFGVWRLIHLKKTRRNYIEVKRLLPTDLNQ